MKKTKVFNILWVMLSILITIGGHYLLLQNLTIVNKGDYQLKALRLFNVLGVYIANIEKPQPQVATLIFLCGIFLLILPVLSGFFIDSEFLKELAGVWLFLVLLDLSLEQWKAIYIIGFGGIVFIGLSIIIVFTRLLYGYYSLDIEEGSVYGKENINRDMDQST